MKGQAFLCLLFVFSAATASLHSQEGESLFKTTCAPCHSIGKGKLVGPDLKNVIDRRSEDWLRKWIKSSQSLVQAGDPEAVKIFKEYNEIVMPDQTISEAEIQKIIDYFKTHPGDSKKELAYDPLGVSEHGNKLANPISHAITQEKEGNMVASLGFGGYLGMMLSGLALVIVLVVLLGFKSKSQQQHPANRH